ncbi:MAG: exodeoxyribonuclease III [Tissierellia bacterium]|nr:exodeoxyribonuclease III [Tissierellia bacterium]
MKLVSWNVNGLRAAVKKGFLEYIQNEDPDIICMQEIKMQEGQLELDLPQYYEFYNYASKAGYSGTAVFTKVEPINVTNGIGIEEHDNEGRVITAEYDNYYLVNVYTPNSKRKLERLDYRQVWEDAFRKFLNELNKKKPVIVCGDLNVAHREIDLANPASNRKNAGFTDEERNKFSELLDSGFIDTFRYFYPTLENAYSWWSYFAKARERNIGWRIDYFLVSKDFENSILDAEIHAEQMGSDHCPVVLFLK